LPLEQAVRHERSSTRTAATRERCFVILHFDVASCESVPRPATH
jgi:hypothetical protein